uniref:restriction endonuclease subunit S n=1 Tax=uncultured Thermosynechococcus sp. TaxID=436945 RepID=UPI002636FF4D
MANEIENLPDGFRMTELGPLPEDWQVVRLGEVMTPVTRDSRRISVQDNQIYALLSVGLYAHGVRVKESVFGKQLKSKVWYRAERGDFLLLKIWARKGSYGFFQADVLNPIVSGDYPILRLDEVRANPDFIGLYLSQSFVWDRLDAGAKGATNRQRVHEREFLSLTTIPLPPLPEQRAIAHVLRTVQEARQASERVIAALRELKRSLMRHLFTYGPVGFTTENTENTEKISVPSGVNLKETEIGPIPAHWQVVRLGEVFEIQQGKSLSPKSRAGSRKRPFLRTANVFWGYIDLSSLDEMHFDETEEKRLALKP